ncbi:MAG: hypothetical protein PHS47_05335 [Methanocellales archaeon]|nr:hypothetical protein [Methanocellales archaeon]MDD3421703.1 hypothetical protein [Methanocellales archaeon]MDD4898854.1 hypothetical protein [Methanocellales archaeon]MDD5447469.1 hypothetical protein [Methanocellales archaeon]
MKKQLTILIVLAIIMTTVVGCLEPREVEAARVNPQTLSEVGWIQVGDVKKDSIKLEWSVTLTINSATMSYKDEELEGRVNLQETQISGINSKLMTIRLALPVGLDFLTNQLIDRAFDLIDTQLMSTVQGMGVSDFHRTGDTTFKNVHGETVKARVYEGVLNYEGGSMRVKGALGLWSSDGSIVAAAGLVPYEDLKYTAEIGGKQVTQTLVKIDGDAEFGELITMMQNVV